MNRLVATDLEAREDIIKLANVVANLAREIKRIAVTQQLDSEVLDRIIDNLTAIGGGAFNPTITVTSGSEGSNDGR